MLKRHEIEVLLKAGHPKIEVAGLAGVSLSSVKRIGEEAPVVHVDDAAGSKSQISGDCRQGNGERGTIQVVDQRSREKQGDDAPSSRIRNGRYHAFSAFWSAKSVPGTRKRHSRNRAEYRGTEEQRLLILEMCGGPGQPITPVARDNPKWSCR